MNRKTAKMAGYVVTGLLTALVLPGGIMQLIAHEQVVALFHSWRIDNMATMRFLGFLKIAGVVAMWTPQGRSWAVHGFTFLFCGALVTHIGAGDAPVQMVGAALGLVFLGALDWLSKQSGASSASSSRGKRRKAA